jgi:hypothetical protein
LECIKRDKKHSRFIVKRSSVYTDDNNNSHVDIKHKEFFMKNRVLRGLMIIMLVFGLALLACNTDTDSDDTAAITKFEGTWVNESAKAKYVFTGNNWRLVRDGRAEDSIGTFTFTESPNSIRFTATGGSRGNWSYTYEFKNDNSILNFTGSNNGPASSTGDFTKQP